MKLRRNEVCDCNTCLRDGCCLVLLQLNQKKKANGCIEKSGPFFIRKSFLKGLKTQL